MLMPNHHNTSKRLDDLRLHHLKALDAVLGAGSVTEAAAQLGITQSALSRQLSRLRELMDDPLVVRARRGVVPTQRGEALAGPLRQALAELTRAIAPSPDWSPQTSRRRFRLGVADHYAPVVMTGLLPHLQREAPGIGIDVRPQPMDPTQALEDGALDLAGGPVDLARDTLRSRSLFTASLACAVSAHHSKVAKSLDLDTYCQLAHVFITPGGSSTGLVDEQLAKLGRERRISVTLPYFIAAPLIVADSNLILTGPERLLRFMADRVPLRILPPPKGLSLPRFRWGLLWHERLHADKGHRWFRSHVARSLRAR